MSYTNLNIKTPDRSFKYIVEYFDDPDLRSEPIKYYSNGFGYFFFHENKENVSYEMNYWNDVYAKDTIQDDTIPGIYNISSFDLYFPRYSVETYEKNTSYVLTINTWINGTGVYLGSYLIDRSNAIASQSGPRKFLNDEYYEHIKIDTIDPFYLLYGDEWKAFREKFCGEKIETGGYQKNNSAANINISLTPVKKVDGTWIKLDGYDSTQSVLTIENKNNNMMHALLEFENNNGDPEFVCTLKFNDLYKDAQNKPDLYDYLKETYQINFNDGYRIEYGFVIGDHEDAYKYVLHSFDTPEYQTRFALNEFKFDSWDDYIEGMCASVFVVISKDDNEILTINSNRVFIEQEKFKYLMDLPIRKINLEEIDMEVKNYDIVNIIKNEVVTVERPNEYKSNIIRPVFVKTQETDTIRLHRSVTENISINLDAYKNKVNAFILKVGDGNFYEIGRMNSGIVFKVVGSSLPQEENEGTYYILNEEGELVTTGNYSIQ